MESKNTFILHETEAFMRGELDNVTVAHGRIVLDLSLIHISEPTRRS